MDLTVVFPAEGVIRLRSRHLFGNPDAPTARDFLERVFQAEEVSNVTIKAGEAELKYCPATYSRKHVVNRVASYLSGKAGANGHATVNGKSATGQRERERPRGGAATAWRRRTSARPRTATATSTAERHAGR